MSESHEVGALAKGLMRTTRFDSRKFFGAVLVAGSASIVAGRWIPIPVLHILLSIIIPVLCIIGYAYANYWNQFASTSRTQTADNCYFLGFLFFLISISATLVVLQADRISVSEVVRGFGTALIVSIVGMGARILLLQESANLGDARQRSEFELTQAVERFRNELVSSTDLLAHSQKAAVDNLRATLEGTGQVLGDTVAAMQSALASGTQHLETTLKSVQIPRDLLTGQLQPLVDGIKSELTRLSQAVKTQTGSTSKASESLTRISEAWSESATRSNELVDSSNRLLSAHNSELEQISSNGRSLTNIPLTLEQINKHAVSLQNSFEGLAGLSESTKIVDIARLAIETTSQLRNEIGTLSTATASLSELSGSVDRLSGHLVAVEKSLDDVATAQATSQHGVNAQLEQFSDKANQILQSLNRIAEEMDRAASQRVGVARFFGGR